MSLHILDTDILVLFQEGHELVCRRVLSHPIDQLATTVITVEEQVSGWFTLLRRAKGSQQLARTYQRLADNVQLLSRFRILSFTEPAIERFEQLKSLKIGVQHSPATSQPQQVFANWIWHYSGIVYHRQRGCVCHWQEH